MPLVRKIINIGYTSQGITLPKSWLQYVEARYGKIRTVSVEVNDKLVVRPILKEAQQNQQKTTTQ